MAKEEKTCTDFTPLRLIGFCKKIAFLEYSEIRDIFKVEMIGFKVVLQKSELRIRG